MRKITWINCRHLDSTITGYCWRPDARHANMNFVVQLENTRGVTIACTINNPDKPTFELPSDIHGNTIRYAVKIITQRLKETENDQRHQGLQAEQQLHLFD